MVLNVQGTGTVPGGVTIPSAILEGNEIKGPQKEDPETAPGLYYCLVSHGGHKLGLGPPGTALLSKAGVGEKSEASSSPPGASPSV